MSNLSVVVGPETILSYKRLAYETWWAFAEFIDNSSQSYLTNKKHLQKAYKSEAAHFEVRLSYDRDAARLRISDNAMGMNLGELERAVQIGHPPADRSGRHEFGMGLKTAACWLGDLWTLRTTKLGDENEYEITFDVNRVAHGDADLRLRTVATEASRHYTVLEISKMHQKIGGRLQGRLLENLRSIYRFDTRDGVMTLWWGDQELSYDNKIQLLTAADGTPYRKDFAFEVDGKSVRGWAGILDAGGRPKAGFAVARRGRLIMGQPAAWRPQSIFGQDTGTNDLINQRIVGEIHLDEFDVSHTKNQILWQNDELDEVERNLGELFQDYRQIARDRRVRGGGPSDVATTVAIDDVGGTLQRPEFSDDVNIYEVPPPEVVEGSLVPIREDLSLRDADVVFKVGDVDVKLFMDNARSSNDPYFVGDYVDDRSVIVSINTHHPFWTDRLSTAEEIAIYMYICVFDAIAEWKCLKMTGEIRPDTVRMVKDSFMRRTIAE